LFSKVDIQLVASQRVCCWTCREWRVVLATRDFLLWYTGLFSLVLEVDMIVT